MLRLVVLGEAIAESFKSLFELLNEYVLSVHPFLSKVDFVGFQCMPFARERINSCPYTINLLCICKTNIQFSLSL